MYRTSFQCPETGQTIIARYAFGRVTLQAVTDDGEEIMHETLVYCNRHTNKRCRSFDEAEEYVIQVSDGQAMSLEPIH